MGKKGRVYVGLSGGVDSATSAAILKEEGYDVVGVFIKVWQPDFFPCTSTEDRLEAMRVAAHLGIPFETLDLSERYKKDIVDSMIAGYRSGETTNPDVLCNKYIKFDAFYKYSKDKGADYIATGHYSRVVLNSKGEPELFSGLDKDKDQSYFLWNVEANVFKNVIFPVGNFTKTEVRKKAKAFGLPNSEKRDSQGLCFIGSIDMKEFLGHFLPQNDGSLVSTNGEEIGRHNGVHFYTLGERHGFRLYDGSQKGPFYIVKRDLKNNVIVVDSDSSIAKENSFYLKDVNLIGELPKDTAKLKCRVRHLGEMIPCELSINGRYKVSLKKKIISSPGQSLVLYSEERCLGGGVIEESTTGED